MDNTADYEILMLDENNTLSEDEEGIRDPATTLSILIIGTFLALLIFLSIAGNILVCVAIYTDRGLRRIGNLFLASLAIADLFVASLVMTFAGVNDLLGYWVFGAQFCDTWVAFDVMCSTASILNLCAISLDRYIHIKDPLSGILDYMHFEKLFENFNSTFIMAGDFNARSPYWGSRHFYTFLQWDPRLIDLTAHLGGQYTDTRSDRYYEEICHQVNGLVFPGGLAKFTNLQGYAASGKRLLKYAMQKKLPIWGISLGMELIIDFVCNNTAETPCNASSVALPLELKDFINSTLLGSAPDEIIEILTTENVTVTENQKLVCTTIKSLTYIDCMSPWRLVASSTALDNQDFISLIEMKDYPVFLSKFHPEKNIFEWNEVVRWVPTNIPHSNHAILVSQYFGRIFFQQVRKNFNRFFDKGMETKALISNYKTTDTIYRDGNYFEQVYYFPVHYDV